MVVPEILERRAKKLGYFTANDGFGNTVLIQYFTWTVAEIVQDGDWDKLAEVLNNLEREAKSAS